jgi:protoporphyrinogen oxidase
MVQRIPKPPAEDILRSAKGEATEGYLHQLFFRYPKQGGIQALFDAFLHSLGDKATVRVNAQVQRLRRHDQRWRVLTADGSESEFDRVVSTIPIPDLAVCLEPAPPTAVADAVARLKVNSIAICCLQVERDRLADNFAVMVADRDIVFHRISKLNFLLPEDRRGGPSVLMAEVTYQQGSTLARLTDDELLQRIGDDLARLGFIRSPGDVTAQEVLRQRWAYVIYDLDHRRNVDAVRNYCEKQLGLVLHGRFGEFEYLNMDAVVERSLRRSKEFIASGC